MDLHEVLSAHRVRAYTDITPPLTISNFEATVNAGVGITLTWTNPTDADYAKTRIVMKKDTQPTTLYDGDVIYEGTNETVEVLGESLTADTTYYFRAYTYDTTGNANKETTGQIVSAKYIVATIYGFAVDETNSNPSTCVTYIENAVGMTPASNGASFKFDGGSWLDVYPFNAIRPVNLDDYGNVEHELNPKNFLQDVDGITNYSNDVRVCIEIPPVYWKFTKTTNGYEVRWSDIKVDDSYHALAHERGGVLKGNLYVGAYEGNISNDALRSVSGSAVNTSRTLEYLRIRATNLGAGFGLMNFHTVTLLQILFVTMFKTLDSQGVFRGYVSNTSKTTTGVANKVGMYYGYRQTDYTLAVMKFMGIENLWGNTHTFMDGIVQGAGGSVMISDNTVFNDTGEGYIYTVSGVQQNSVAYPKSVVGETIGGFLPTSNGGSSSTYYCDQMTYCTTNYPLLAFGGFYNDGSAAGIFRTIGYGVFTEPAEAGARLQYLAP